jgi:adenylosuccinate lyase
MSGEVLYRSPLDTRYASVEMRAIFSEQDKFSTWRRLWLWLATAEREVGVSADITEDILRQMADRVEVTDEDLAKAKEEEKQ